MTRPRKYTVDFFPHICKQGKTIYIIEARYGNNGYAFWFKLLELLASTEGHYFNANDPLQLEFLAAKTKLSAGETGDILNLLATLDAIDKDLWLNHKIIWCQKLVDNVSTVYEDRKGLMPEKPYFTDGILHQNIDNHSNPQVLPPNNPLNPADNPQTRLEDIKLDKTKQEKTKLKRDNKLSPELIKELKHIFGELKNLRGGYDSPRGSAEGKAIKNMLLKGYSSNQIIDTWKNLKKEPFWCSKELYMNTVESQIGAITHKKEIINENKGFDDIPENRR